jgi:hypothetical protein
VSVIALTSCEHGTYGLNKCCGWYCSTSVRDICR